MLFPTTTATFTNRFPAFGRPTFRQMPAVNIYAHYGPAFDFGLAYIDTMSDVILLPDSVAQKLKLDLRFAPAHTITVVGGSQVVVQFAEITLELRHPRTPIRWTTEVAFGPTQRWLFGHFGGLEFFHFTLDTVNEELILAPRENLPVAE